jgi:hypothetical protein
MRCDAARRTSAQAMYSTRASSALAARVRPMQSPRFADAPNAMTLPADSSTSRATRAARKSATLRRADSCKLRDLYLRCTGQRMASSATHPLGVCRQTARPRSNQLQLWNRFACPNLSPRNEMDQATWLYGPSTRLFEGNRLRDFSAFRKFVGIFLRVSVARTLRPSGERWQDSAPAPTTGGPS